MRRFALVATLLVGLTNVAAAATEITVNNRPLVATVEPVAEAPDALSRTLQAELKKHGWHDLIFNNATPEKAFLFFTQRIMSGGKISAVKVTFWKAIKHGDETQVMTWVASLKPSEVNQFLDEEFARLAMQFKVAKS